MQGNAGGTAPGLWPFTARRPAAPVAVGLMLGIFIHAPIPHWPGASTLLLGALLVAAVLARGRAWIGSILLMACSVLAGVALAQASAFRYPRDHISGFALDQPRLAQLELKLDHPSRELTWPFGQYRAMPPRQVTTAAVRQIKTWTGWERCRGEVLVQIMQPHPRLQQGQVIRIIGTLERPGPAMNPGQFDWAGYYREQRILASVQIAHADNITILRQERIGAIAWLRAEARRALAMGFDSQQQLDHALMRALLLGDNDPELRDVQEQFRRTGTSHHLAISGMHVAVLGGVVFLVCRMLRLRPRLTCWVAMMFVIVYGLVALPSPPVVRSVILSASFALGILSRRSTDGVQLLSLSAIAMLVYHPMDLFNAGFQLSFGTVLGLMLLTPHVMGWLPGRDIDAEIAERLQRYGRFSVMLTKLKFAARATVAAAIVAWVVSLPLVALHFEQLNPWAIPASILLAPIVFLALIGGFAKVLLTIIWPSLAETWAQLAATPIAWMRYTVDALAKLPGADVPLPSPPVWMVLLYYALLLSMLIRWRWKWMEFSWRAGALAGCAALGLIPLREGFAVVRARAGELRLTLLAVGAGQCAVIEPPGEPATIVDAGSATLSDVPRKVLGPFLRNRGRRDVAAMFISHANYDHFSAALEVAQAYGVGQIWVSPHFRRQSVDNPPAEGLLRALDGMDCPPRQIEAGRTLDLGSGAALEVLWPAAECEMDTNNTSLVMKLSFAGRTVLLPGDAQGPALRELLKRAEILAADVLVAPHHGALESVTGPLLDAVAPGQIICSNDRKLSVRQRDFDQATRDRVVYRTHTSGAITIRISRAGQIELEPFLSAPAPAEAP